MNSTSGIDRLRLNGTLAKTNGGSAWETHGFVVFMETYYSMGLLVLGTIGNLLCLAVLSRKTFRRSSIGIYLRFLTLSDLMALYTGVLYFTARALFDLDFRKVNELSCKFHRWLSFVACDLSSWALVLVSIARLISIAWPMKRINTRKRAYVILLITVVVIFATNLPIYVIYGDVTDVAKNKTKQCTITNDSYTQFYNHVFSWIVLLKFSFLPFVLLIILNTALVISVYRSNQTIINIQSSSASPSLSAAVSIKITVSRWRQRFTWFRSRCNTQEMDTSESGLVSVGDSQGDHLSDKNNASSKDEETNNFWEKLGSFLARLKGKENCLKDKDIDSRSLGHCEDLHEPLSDFLMAEVKAVSDVSSDGELAREKGSEETSSALSSSTNSSSACTTNKYLDDSNPGGCSNTIMATRFSNGGEVHIDTNTCDKSDNCCNVQNSAPLSPNPLEDDSYRGTVTRQQTNSPITIVNNPLEDNSYRGTVTRQQKNSPTAIVNNPNLNISSPSETNPSAHADSSLAETATIFNEANISSNQNNRNNGNINTTTKQNVCNMNNQNVTTNHSSGNILHLCSFHEQGLDNNESHQHGFTQTNNPSSDMDGTITDQNSITANILSRPKTTMDAKNICLNEESSVNNYDHTSSTKKNSSCIATVLKSEIDNSERELSLADDVKSRQDVGKTPLNAEMGRPTVAPGPERRMSDNISEYSVRPHKMLKKTKATKAGQAVSSTPSSRSKSLTITLLVLNTVFLVFTTPITVYMTGRTYIWPNNQGQYIASQDITSTVANFCMYTNNATNFILYCITGSKFRGQLLLMFREVYQAMRRGCTRCGFRTR